MELWSPTDNVQRCGYWRLVAAKCNAQGRQPIAELVELCKLDRQVQWSSTARFPCDIFIKLSATDSSGVSVSDEFTLSITPVNDAPVLSSPLEDVSVAEEATFKFFRPSPNSFTDVDGDALTYSATLESGAALPSWLKFTPSTGEFSGTAPTDFNGDIFIKVTAEDAKLSASDVFKLSITPVNDAPVALDPSFGSISEDVSFSGTLGTTPLDFIKFATDVDSSLSTTSFNFTKVTFKGTELSSLMPQASSTIRRRERSSSTHRASSFIRSFGRPNQATW